MSLTGISASVTELPGFNQAVDALNTDPGGSIDVVKGLWPFLIARASATAPVVAVTSTGREAEELTEALADHLAPSSVAFFPSWETLPHERLSPRSDTVGKRLSV